MKRLFVGALFCLIPLLGCTKESPEGGPGAMVDDDRNVRRDVTDNGRPVQPSRTDGDLDNDLDDNVFTMVVPRAATNIEPGEKEDVTIKINRDDDFRQAVRIMIQPQPGVTVEPQEAVIEPGSSETKFLIGAAVDAPLGEKALTVVGIPDQGREVTMTLDVNVDN
jgi:hypothetical protein